MENKELETWLEETKEKEFSPKRGDRVLVWDGDDDPIERIFLQKIERATNPFLVVASYDEKNYFENKSFDVLVWEHMKPLPAEQLKETDFKSQVIELIEKRIEICKELIDENKNENKFIAAQMWKNCDIEAREILRQIKELC